MMLNYACYLLQPKQYFMRMTFLRKIYTLLIHFYLISEILPVTKCQERYQTNLFYFKLK